MRLRIALLVSVSAGLVVFGAAASADAATWAGGRGASRPPSGLRPPVLNKVVTPTLTLRAVGSDGTPTRLGYTAHPLIFRGLVEPAVSVAGEHIYLQHRQGPHDWRTVGSGVVDAAGAFEISESFVSPGWHDMRARFNGSGRVAAAASATVAVMIRQSEVAGFTINTLTPVIDDGASATILGRLRVAGGTRAPKAGVEVTPWGRSFDRQFTPLARATTGPGGRYDFPVAPHHSTQYYVRTTVAPFRRSAWLSESVGDVVTMAASAQVAALGCPVALTGSVAPDKAGELIELQVRAGGGAFRTVATDAISSDSDYEIVWRGERVGTYTLRTRVPGDRMNNAGVAAPVQLTVSSAPTASLSSTC